MLYRPDGRVERVKVRHAAGGQHPLELVPEQVEACGHHALEALLRVTLRIYTRHVTPVEERKIISNAANKNRMDRGNTSDLQTTGTFSALFK